LVIKREKVIGEFRATGPCVLLHHAWRDVNVAGTQKLFGFDRLKDNSEKEVVMKRYALSLAFVLVFGIGGFAQTRSPVEGVWKITEWTEKGKTNANPQPGLIIFTRRYYSTAILMAPRVALTSSVAGPELTDAKKLELFE
jgi:hypothetical protein